MALKANCSISLEQVALNRADEIGEPAELYKDPVRHIAWGMSIMTPASALARRSELFRRVYDTWHAKQAYRNFLMSDHEDMLAKITRTPKESRQRINAALEYLRLSKTPITRTGRKFSIKTKLIEREGKDGINRAFRPALSKPGDIISLSKEETELLHEVRDYLDNRYTLNAKSYLSVFGYDGEYSLEGIKALPDTTPDEIKFRDSLLKLYNAIESQRVTSYIPFMRSGDLMVRVYGPDGTIETGAFYMLQSNAWLKDIVGPSLQKFVPEGNVKEQFEAIKKKFPEKDGFRIDATRFQLNRSQQPGVEDLSSLDRLMGLMNSNSGRLVKDYFDSTMGGIFNPQDIGGLTKDQYDLVANGLANQLPETLRSLLMEKVAAGFMKQSRDIAGYDTNFLERLFDYNRIVATTVSHRVYRKEYSLAKDEASARLASNEKKYLENWDNYVDTPEHEILKAAKTIGYFNAMWGSFASASLNATAAWLVVAPQMTVMKASAGLDVYKQSVKALAGMRGRAGIGLVIDPYKIPGLSQAERDALVLAFQRGTVRSQINPELMGMEAGFLAQRGGAFGKKYSEYFQIGGSALGVMEEVSKIGAFLTAYKYAQDPKALANWKEAFKNNARARAIMDKGSDPFDVAEFMVETTTFIGGQVERPPILRGPGGVILQFSQYPLQLMRLIAQNFLKMGPRGKVAGMFTLISIWSVGGLLYGIPLGDDMINVFEALYNMLFDEKVNFRYEMQALLVEALGGDNEAELNAEAFMYGPMRALLGIDIGKRVGFSSMMPELGNPYTAIPALSTTVGRWQEAYERYKNDQPIAASIAALAPFMGKGVYDVVKGFVQYPNEGYRTRYDTAVKAPEEITFGDKFTRSLGFQSADLARRSEARRIEKEIEEGPRGPQRRLTTRLSKIMAEAIKAEEAGEMARGARLREEFYRVFGEARDKFSEAIKESREKNDPGIMARAIKPPSSQVLQDGILRELHPELSITKRGKIKQAAMIQARDTIMAGETEGDFFEDQIEEEEEELLEE